jgi:hypothetical protein
MALACAQRLEAQGLTMATIAVAAAIGASGLSGPALIAAQVIGGTLAAFADSSIILPSLFPQPDVKGPRLGDFRFGTADEGDPIPEPYGRNVRVPCQIVETSELIEERNTTASNGKGGSGGQYVEYTYSRHLLVSIGRGPIQDVKKIWANGRVIYNRDPDFDLVDNDELSGTATQIWNWGNWFQNQTGHYKYYLKFESPDGGPDLSQIRVGHQITITNAGASNDGSWEVVDAGTNPDSSTFFQVRRSALNGHGPFSSFAAGAETLTLHQDLENFDPKAMATAPNFLRGSDGRMGSHDQPVDATFEQLRGVGEVPAYRGLAVFSIKNLQLFDSGNMIPNIVALVEESATRTVGEAIELIATDGAIASDEVDAPIDDALDGYTPRGPMVVAQKLSPLMIAHELVSWEDGPVLRFLKREDIPELAIDELLLAARAEGESVARPLQVHDVDHEPAERVNVRFQDTTKNYQSGLRAGFRQSLSTSIVRTYDLPVNMTPERAEVLAQRLVLLDEVSGRSLSLSLPPSLVDQIHEAMRLTFTAEGRDWKVFVLGVDRGVAGVLQVRCVEDQPQIFEIGAGDSLDFLGDDGSASATLGAGTQHRSAAALPLEFHVIDCPSLRDEHQDAPGLYVAAGLTSQSESWTSVSMFESLDPDGETWSRVMILREQATIGFTLTELGEADAGVWDETNTVDVELTSGELESVTQLSCLNGQNRILLGGEIIGFRRATSIGENQYRLSGLLRGLRATEGEITEHEAGDRVILLTGPGIYFHRLSIASVGMTRYLKAVTPGGILDEFETVAIAPDGNNVKPFAPCNVSGARDGSNNLTISWTRVTRAIVRLLSPQAIPVLEPEEGYEIDVYDGTWTTVLRTITSSTTSASYSAADQTTDGLTPGNPVNVRAYQTSDLLRRGFAATATV